MQYNIANHIYIAQFRNELILLDTKKDKYTVCFREIGNLLLSLLGEKQLDLAPPFSRAQILLNAQKVQKLHSAGIIEKRDTAYVFPLDRKLNSNGAPNVDWRLPLEGKKINTSFSVLKAVMVLVRVNFYVKFKGFYSTIQLIKTSRKNHLNYICPTATDLVNLATILNRACCIYPIRTKCLEWAITFILLALKLRWKCNLEIGVQNYPFSSHAWVECDGKVVMDAQNLREELAIILSEPFRRKT